MPSPEEFTELGAIEHGRAVIRERVVGAWDDFIHLAERVDMDADSRLPGWHAREICVHLGSWDDHKPIAGVLAAARAVKAGKGPNSQPGLDDVARNVNEAHADASRDDIVAALTQARDQAAEYLTPTEPQELDRVLVVSSVGPLPALTILHAQVYELAVHSLDLQSAGAPAPSAALLDAGLAALTDAAGALAARVGIVSTSGIHSELGFWAFRSYAEGWQIGHWDDDAAAKSFVSKLPVRVDASATVLLEASAGRTNALKALATRRLRVHGLPGLMGLAPIVENVPGIPGAPALRVAARGLAGAGGALGRLTRR